MAGLSLSVLRIPVCPFALQLPSNRIEILSQGDFRAYNHGNSSRAFATVFPNRGQPKWWSCTEMTDSWYEIYYNFVSGPPRVRVSRRSFNGNELSLLKRYVDLKRRAGKINLGLCGWSNFYSVTWRRLDKWLNPVPLAIPFRIDLLRSCRHLCLFLLMLERAILLEIYFSRTSVRVIGNSGNEIIFHKIVDR